MAEKLGVARYFLSFRFRSFLLNILHPLFLDLAPSAKDYYHVELAESIISIILESRQID